MRKKYLPSNGCEGMRFESQNCHQCWRGRSEKYKCKTLLKALVADRVEDGPEEWEVNDDGRAICTRKQEKKPRSKKKENTMPLFKGDENE